MAWCAPWRGWRTAAALISTFVASLGSMEVGCRLSDLRGPWMVEQGYSCGEAKILGLILIIGGVFLIRAVWQSIREEGGSGGAGVKARARLPRALPHRLHLIRVGEGPRQVPPGPTSIGELVDEAIHRRPLQPGRRVHDQRLRQGAIPLVEGHPLRRADADQKIVDEALKDMTKGDAVREGRGLAEEILDGHQGRGRRRGEGPAQGPGGRRCPPLTSPPSATNAASRPRSGFERIAHAPSTSRAGEFYRGLLEITRMEVERAIRAEREGRQGVTKPSDQ